MAKSPSDTVLAELQKLGFSDYEIRTYTALLQENPATAYQISKTANIPRANTYSVLESLSRKNAVLKVSQNPGRFIPIPPNALFQKIAEDTHARCTYLEAELSKIDTTNSTEAVWNLEGQAKIDDKVSNIIDEAEKHIWIKAHKSVIDRFVPALKNACQRGVSLLIILFGADHNPFDIVGDVVVLPHEGNGIRMGDADNFFTITTDFSSTLTANTTDLPIAAYTQSRPIVTISESLIRHDLYMAEIFIKFGDQIDQEFGPHLYKIRSKYFSPQQMVKYSHTIAEISDVSIKGKKRSTNKPTTARKS